MQQFDFSLIKTERPLALFVDIDGTLLELARTPGSVVVPPELPRTLQRLTEESALALITGRPIESADRLFQPTKFPIAGLHGGEFRFASEIERPDLKSIPDEWRDEAKMFAASLPGVYYEDKRYGYSLHFRHTPQYGAEVMAYMTAKVDGHPDFNLLHASMAGEIRPNGVDKGHAIRRFMQQPDYAGRHPVFFGDDFTDEDGFRAIAELNGTSVLVGERRPSAAMYQLPDPACLRGLLAALDLCERQYI